MDLFYSTCPAGLEGPAARVAARSLASFRLEKSLGGALLYRCAESSPRLEVFQNTYLVLAEYPGAAALERIAARAAADRQVLRRADEAMRQRGLRTFRVMFSDRNRLAAVGGGVREAFERTVASARADRVSPQTELLLLRRSEGFALLLLRLTRREGTPKTLARGELSPAVAACMVELCAPRPDGVFLDPFAGHGAVGAARRKAGPCARLLLSDADPAMVEHMRGKKPLARAEIALRDALRLDEALPAACVTELAADPPWGLWEPLPMPAEEFYARMLGQFAYVLAPGGRMCVLTAAKREFEAAAAQYSSALRFDPRVDLLVNGKKAALYPALRL